MIPNLKLAETRIKAARALDWMGLTFKTGGYEYLLPTEAARLADEVRGHYSRLSPEQNYERQIAGEDGQVIEALELMAEPLYSKD